jgi:predicted RNA binding protein YcfA (HicA-like mRNA interferase family)
VAAVNRILARLQRRPPEAAYADVRRVLEAYGWVLQRETGSHAAFVKAGERTLIIPKVGGRRVKRVYIVQVLQQLGLEN